MPPEIRPWNELNLQIWAATIMRPIPGQAFHRFMVMSDRVERVFKRIGPARKSGRPDDSSRP
jgi:hypothetical protein